MQRSVPRASALSAVAAFPEPRLRRGPLDLRTSITVEFFTGGPRSADVGHETRARLNACDGDKPAKSNAQSSGRPSMTDESGQRLLRLSVSYMLDQLATARVIFDILDSLIAVAVSQANVAPVNASRELQLRYATYDQPPPDDLRRPISINALAQSLRLPFETVRRRLIKLSLLGVCQSTRAGVMVPTRALLGPIHHGALERNDQLTAELWRRASDDLQGPHPGGGESVWADRPLRLLSRVAFDYVLRLGDQLSEVFGDPTSVAVWAATIEADEAPISMQAIARRVQLSPETVRRRVHELVGQNRLQISPSGVVPSPEFLRSEAIDRVVARNRTDLLRLFAVLSDLGVIGYWARRAPHKAA